MNCIRKTIIFIVEGPSEETALALPLGNHFSSDSLRFTIVHGDLTSEKQTTAANVISRIHQLVKREMSLYGLKPKDLKTIVHLIDTDGVFIENSAVKKTVYSESCILTPNPDSIIDRNKSKSSVVNRLIRCHEIGNVPYTPLFMSCNLDHVIGYDANASTQMKVSYAEAFQLKYAEDPAGFINFVREALPPADDIRQSWQFIQKRHNSLKRFSNLALFLDN